MSRNVSQSDFDSRCLAVGVRLEPMDEKRQKPLGINRIQPTYRVQIKYINCHHNNPPIRYMRTDYEDYTITPQVNWGEPSSIHPHQNRL